MDIPMSAVEFYEAAKALRKQVDSIEICDKDNIGDLLKSLTELYLKALSLPSPEHRDFEELSDAKKAKQRAIFEMGILYRQKIYHASQIDFKSKNCYYEFFDPYDAGSAATATLSMDLDDMLEDIGTGIYLYEHGYQADALSEWRSSFMSHWGEHSTGAIRALDSIYRRCDRFSEEDCDDTL